MAVSHGSRVCLLGGTGFVGRSLIGLLSENGYEVAVPTRSRERNRNLLVIPSLDLIEADVHDQSTLTRLLHGCDAAINLIGILNEAGHDGAGFKRAHADLAQTLVYACQRSGVQRLLQMSALKADAQLGPSHYLRTKGQAENIIKASSGQGLKYTIFRPSVIFGAHDSFTNRFAALLRLLPVLPLARAQARFAPVFVEDVAHAFVAALHNSESYGRTYELCGPDIYSLRELVSFIRRLLGRKRIIVPLPRALGRLQALIGDYLLPGKPFSLDNFRSLEVASVCAEDGLALLGIKPHSLPAIAPTYLGSASRHGLLARLRQGARR
jgi:NADH dehydrogenase